jgi:DNA polymerase-1
MPDVTQVSRTDVAGVVSHLRAPGAAAGTPVGLAIGSGVVGVAAGDLAWAVDGPAAEVVRLVSEACSPRWVWWSAGSLGPPEALAGLGVTACWDLSAVHRLEHGGTAAGPALVWAAAQGLPETDVPRAGQLDLLAPPDEATGADDPEQPVRSDGYLRPDWAETAPATPERAARWAALALQVQAAQLHTLLTRPDPRARTRGAPLAVLTAWSESAAALLAVELAASGLPLDRSVAERLITRHVGPRPRDEAAAVRDRRSRDDEVRRHVPGAEEVDLRNPAQVRELLGRIGIDVPDTRSWRLEPLRAAHPAVAALLDWRKSERIATTYGYSWLDSHVAADGRLRGAWSGSDGAAGRMTAQAGLHNLPAELRAAVLAEPDHVFVRADLGQVEPRVLAAVSGDQAFAEATRSPDLYTPVADRLGCDRPTAKVAVLAAMYGQTSGAAGSALQAMDKAYPVAMRFLRAAEEEGKAGRDVRTYGGRLVRMYPLSAPVDAAAVAARGRYARNAVVQGAAAELFKMWAVTVRAALRADVPGAAIVLCLHDELLLHVPRRSAAEVVTLLRAALAEAAGRWATGSPVGFVAEVATVDCWADAKDATSLTTAPVVRRAP